jgi:hypothetical protein
MYLRSTHRFALGLVGLSLAVLTSPVVAQESPYIYGIHDHEPSPQEFLNHLNSAGITGWVTATVAIGANPNDNGGTDFRWISNQGHSVICRINFGYCDIGTIPLPAKYADFATRCAKFVQASQGCSIWVIGNETNLAGEWPPSNGYKSYVSPQSYAQCFRLVYDAIKAVRPTHKVVSQALAPWAGPYGTGNACGFNHDGMPLNWVQYSLQMLNAIKGSGPGPDGIALHTPSRGYTYADIHSTGKVNAGGQNLYFSFYAYKDFINLGIPSSMYNLPLYSTESNGNYYWKGGHPENPAAHYEAGWMQAMYAEINRWNTQEAPAAGKPIFHCLNLYRWCGFCDPWNFDSISPNHVNPYKGLMFSDLDAAFAQKYRWPTTPTAPVANFTATPTSGSAPLTVSFTETSTGQITTRTWAFGDNGTSSATNPSHTYQNPGTYTVGLAVSGPAGSDTEIKLNYITVTPPRWKGDFDDDGDVDLSDYGRFQACFSGPGNEQPDPACARARLQGNDDDVDQEDFAVFQACLSGANNPAPANCRE